MGCISGLTFAFDRDRYWSVDADARRLIPIRGVGGVLLDVFERKGVPFVLCAPTKRTLEIRSGWKMTLVKQFSNLHQLDTMGGVLDSARERLITIGIESRHEGAQEEIIGSGSICVWDFNGNRKFPSHSFDGIPVSIARDGRAQIVAVALYNGDILLLNVGESRLEEVGRFEFVEVSLNPIKVRLSSDGRFVGASSVNACKFWRTDSSSQPPILVVSISDYLWDNSHLCFLGEQRAICGIKKRLFSISLEPSPEVEFEIDLGIYIEGLSISPQTGCVVVVGYKEYGDKHMIYKFDISSKELTVIE